MDSQPNIIKIAALEPTGTPSGTDTTTLNGAITAAGTTIVLENASAGDGFNNDDLIEIGNELILLKNKSTNTFTGCVRARAGSTRTKANVHNSGVTVTLKEAEDFTYDGSFIVPVEVLGTRKLVIAYVMAGDSGGDAKILMSSSTNFGNQPS